MVLWIYSRWDHKCSFAITQIVHHHDENTFQRRASIWWFGVCVCVRLALLHESIFDSFRVWYFSISDIFHRRSFRINELRDCTVFGLSQTRFFCLFSAFVLPFAPLSSSLFEFLCICIWMQWKSASRQSSKWTRYWIESEFTFKLTVFCTQTTANASKAANSDTTNFR